MTDFNFKIKAKDKKTKARTGVIQTGHGEILTPSFVPVGTLGTVKSLAPKDLKEIGVQIFFGNTYHLYLRPGMDIVKKFGGLHNFIGWDKPLITDSGGFQVFSLARSKRGEKKEGQIRGEENISAPLVKITEDGVYFRSHLDGSAHFFTPEKSIEIQNILGADIMIAFDECTYYPSTHEYSKSAMERTHRWAERCLIQKSKIKSPAYAKASAGKQKSKQWTREQALYGVVQGGIYEDLRKESAKFISNLPFEGIAIGGVAVGESKKEMTDVLDWTVPYLPEEKPRHLLGVGEIDDIFELVKRGIDTFDCVMPTRLGRMGFVLSKSEIRNSKSETNRKYTFDISKAEFAEDKKPIDEDCQCFVCRNHSRAYLHHLFRAKELSVYRLLTYHNLWFTEKLLSSIRNSIEEENFLELEKQWL